jgi:hypothetical protein
MMSHTLLYHSRKILSLPKSEKSKRLPNFFHRFQLL